MKQKLNALYWFFSARAFSILVVCESPHHQILYSAAFFLFVVVVLDPFLDWAGASFFHDGIILFRGTPRLIPSWKIKLPAQGFVAHPVTMVPTTLSWARTAGSVCVCIGNIAREITNVKTEGWCCRRPCGFANAGWHPDGIVHYLHVTDNKRSNKWRQMRSEKGAAAVNLVRWFWRRRVRLNLPHCGGCGSSSLQTTWVSEHLVNKTAHGL